jgi:UDP-N-acetylglucosamine 1-carboxyvinyltransferase
MTSLIKGVDSLKGTEVEGKDLRGGAALILAGLAAEGQTIVTNANFVERGYEHIEDTLCALGGDVRLMTEI